MSTPTTINPSNNLAATIVTNPELLRLFARCVNGDDNYLADATKDLKDGTIHAFYPPVLDGSDRRQLVRALCGTTAWVVRLPNGPEVAVAATECRDDGGALVFVNRDGTVVYRFGPGHWAACWESLPGPTKALAIIEIYNGEE